MKTLFASFVFLSSAALISAADAPSAETASQGLQAAFSSLLSQASTTVADGKTAQSEVSVPMPGKLAKLESTLRAAGQGQLVDDFKTKLKDVVLQSLPQSASMLKDSTGGLKFDDALAVLNTAPTGLTDFVKGQTRTPVVQKLIPVVMQNSKVAGLAASYQAMVAKAGPMAATMFGKQPPANIDQYLAEQALDYTYTLVGKGEAVLRANPSVSKNALVQKVFAAAKK